ncbi:MAG: FG-GAP-like repeat-containing protein [Phenylobacterium sp.]
MPVTFTADPKYLAPGVTPWPTPATTTLLAADWNGDHILDIGMTGIDWPNGAIKSQLQVWLGQPDGGYAVASNLFGAPVITAFTRMMTTADFNGDNRPDIYLGTLGDEIKATGEADVVLLSTPGGTLVRAGGAALNRPTYSHGSSVGDIDNDGDIDIFQSGGYVAPGQSTGPTLGSRLLLNDGAGNFTDASARLPADLQAAAYRTVFASAVADLNGDGFADLIVGHKGGHSVTLRTNPDGSTWQEYKPTGYQGGYYLNDGKGGFLAFKALPVGALPAWNSDTIDIRVFDANGDGRPDVLFSNYNTGWVSDGQGDIRYTGDGSENEETGQGLWRDVQLFINSGAGFTDASSKIEGAGNGPGGSAPIFQFFPVDLDGDGRLDLVGGMPRDMIRDTAAGNFAWLQTADGRFTPFDMRSVLAQSGLPSVWNIAVFDANADGRPDIGYNTMAPIAGGGGSGPSFGVLLNTTTPPNAAGQRLLGSNAGGDAILGGTGHDTITASSGPNFLRGGAGDDVIAGGQGFDDAHGNMGNDTVSGGRGPDWVVGGKDNDRLSGDEGDDVVYGNLGNDTQSGGPGVDWVRGGQGDDVLDAGAGNDWISGDKGSDTITGGAGADLFHTHGEAGVDRVLDFNRAEGDVVNLLAGTTYTVAQVGADTVISMTGGGQMTLVGVPLSSLTSGWIFGA